MYCDKNIFANTQRHTHTYMFVLEYANRTKNSFIFVHLSFRMKIIFVCHEITSKRNYK